MIRRTYSRFGAWVARQVMDWSWWLGFRGDAEM